MMKSIIVLTCLVAAINCEDELKVEKTLVPEICETKSKNGDMLTMHYTGTLVDGTKFDSSLLFFFQKVDCHCPKPHKNKTTDYDLFQQNKEVRSISDATVATIRSFYVKNTPVLSISRSSTDLLTYQKQSEILNRVTLSTSTEIAYTIEEPQHLRKAVRAYNLFFVDGVNGFRRIFKKLSAEHFNFAGYYTIVLTERVKDPRETVKSILTDLWSMHVINVNVLTFENSESGTSVFTFFPYSENHCGVVRPVLWDYYTDGRFMNDSEVFVKKLDNFYGCPLTLGTYNIPPYVILRQYPNETIPPILQGFEGILFRVLSQKLNFRTVIIIAEGQYLNSLDNFEMLKNNEVNVTMQAIINTMSLSEHFTATFPHHYISVVITMLVHIPFTSIEKLLLPFEPAIWLALICTLTLAFILITIVEIRGHDKRSFVFGRANHSPFLNTINILLGGAIMRPPTRVFARTLLAFWLFGTLVLRSSYQGALFDFLHSQKSAKTLDTLEKLVDNNYPIYASPQLYKMLYEDSPHWRNNLKLHNGSLEIMTSQKTQQPPGVFVGTIDMVGYHNTLYHKNGVLVPSKRRIYLLPLGIFFQKYSCLMPPFNKYIEMLHTGGFIQMWSKIYQTIYLPHQLKHSVPRKISIEQVSGIYIIALYASAFCLLVFLVELLSLKIRWLQIVFKYS